MSEISPEALSLVRQRRDEILQMLEEEEEREERRTEEEHKAELQRKRVLARREMEKRLLNQGFEVERRRKAKELEVQMAKALVGIDRDATPMTCGDQKKKVAFATVSEEAKPAESGTKQPMTREVIERIPVSLSQKYTSHTPLVHEFLSAETSAIGDLARAESVSSRTITFTDNSRDSDDESELGDEDNTNSETSADTFDDETVLSPKRRRELALEYNKIREALGFRSNDLQMAVDSPDWNQENVPLDASLAGRPPKSSVSKFKESRISRHTETTIKRFS